MVTTFSMATETCISSVRGESMHTFFLPKAKGVNSETGLMEFWIDPEDESKGGNQRV